MRIRFDGFFCRNRHSSAPRQCACAIYLGNVATEFDLIPTSVKLLGQIQPSGIYLKEDDTPGTVQAWDRRVALAVTGFFSRRSLHAIADRRELLQVDDAVELIGGFEFRAESQWIFARLTEKSDDHLSGLRLLFYFDDVTIIATLDC